MAKDLLYIKTFPEQCYINSSGVGFRLFYDAITNKPKNLLLLSNAFAQAKIDQDIFIEYADTSTIALLYQDDIYNYGDFCWVDYSSDDKKKELKPQILAELLYLNHYKKPLYSPFWNELENEYAYLAHDDDWWTKIYMRNVELMKPVIHHKVLSELKGRKKQIANLPTDILDAIWAHCENGLAIDFETATVSGSCTGVRFYPIGVFENMNEMYQRLCWLRTKLVSDSGWLEYNPRNKKWRIY